MAVGATAIWRVRPSGSNTNGGGYDPGISGAATDYSQQNAAQASGSHGTATGTTAFSDTVAANFTSAMVGNCIQIVSGAGFTAGFYFVTAFTSSTAVVLDRSPGTGTVAVWNLGGGWADFTNTASSGPAVQGNIFYILGSGTPNPASYTYDYTIASNVALSGTANVSYLNDPATPGYLAPPNTNGGMPVIKVNVSGGNGFTISATVFIVMSGLWFVGTTNIVGSGLGAVRLNNGVFNAVGCVFDQLGFDCSFLVDTAQQPYYGSFVYGCEIFSSVTGTAGTAAGISCNASSHTVIDGCNIHDCISYGVYDAASGASIQASNNIIAKCQKDGINIYGYSSNLLNNTIDGNLGNGITIASYTNVCAVNNIISNHTQAGKYGISYTGAASPGGQLFIDYNVYYNNTSNYNSVTAGPHDTALGSNPYVGQSTENYTLA